MTTFFWNSLRFKSKDARTRVKVIEGIDPEKHTEAHVFELLAAALRDEDAGVRCAAAKVLGGIPSETAPRLLVPILLDHNLEVRQAAATALGKLGDISVADSLVDTLKDPNPSVRASAAAALRNLNWRASTAEEQAQFEVALGHARFAALQGDVAVNPLLSELTHNTGFARRAAAEALEGVHDPRRIKPLLAALCDEEPTVRVSAIHALRTCTGEEVAPALVKAFHDIEACVRLAAAQVLSKKRDASFVPHFIPLLNDKHFEVRLTALQFLAHFREARITTAVLPMLKDKDNDVRLAAAKTLGEAGDPAAIEGLVFTLIDDERNLRQAAELALSQLDPNWAQSEAARRACGAIEKSLVDKTPWVRAAAQQVLARLRPPTSSEPKALQMASESKSAPRFGPRQIVAPPGRLSDNSRDR